MHGKSIRQRNVRQDNTMDRAGTLPLNLHETETVLKPVNLNSLKGMSSHLVQMMISVAVYQGSPHITN